MKSAVEQQQRDAETPAAKRRPNFLKTLATETTDKSPSPDCDAALRPCNLYKYPNKDNKSENPVLCSRQRTVDGEDVVSSSSGSNASTPLRSPSLHFAGFFHRLRQRTVSESVNDISSLANAVMDVSLSGGPRPGSKMSVVSEEVNSVDSGYRDLSRRWPDFDDLDELTPQNRIRSRSEASRFIVLRKMSRPNAAEVVGRFSEGEKPIRKILTMFTCYDLMKKQNGVVVIDTRLTTRQALTALLSNGTLVALVWESSTQSTVGIMTITDLLGIMLSSNDQLVDWFSRALKDWIFDSPNQWGSARTGLLTCINASEKVLTAGEMLCHHRLHRIPVVDPDTRNFLFMLSTSQILHFLHKYLSSLPLPQDMYRPIDQWKVGTWTDVRSVQNETTISQALSVLLKHNISSMPVVTLPDGEDRRSVVTNILSNVDIVNYLAKNGWKNFDQLSVQEVVDDRHSSVESLVTVHRSAPLLLAIDVMVRQQVHRLVIISGENELLGILSIRDILKVLFLASSA